MRRKQVRTGMLHACTGLSKSGICCWLEGVIAWPDRLAFRQSSRRDHHGYLPLSWLRGQLPKHSLAWFWQSKRRPSCFGHSVGREKGLRRGSKPRHLSAHFGPGLGIRNEVLACHCLTIHAPTTTIVIESLLLVLLPSY